MAPTAARTVFELDDQEKQTGVKTYRTEREILESLPADVLAAVAAPE